MQMKEIEVWDPLVRTGHWLLATAVIIAWFVDAALTILSSPLILRAGGAHSARVALRGHAEQTLGPLRNCALGYSSSLPSAFPVAGLTKCVRVQAEQVIGS